MPGLPPRSSHASITPAVACDCSGRVSWWVCHLQILATPAMAQRAAWACVAHVTVMGDHFNEVLTTDSGTYAPQQALVAVSAGLQIQCSAATPP